MQAGPEDRAWPLSMGWQRELGPAGSSWRFSGASAPDLHRQMGLVTMPWPASKQRCRDHQRYPTNACCSNPWCLPCKPSHEMLADCGQGCLPFPAHRLWSHASTRYSDAQRPCPQHQNMHPAKWLPTTSLCCSGVLAAASDRSGKEDIGRYPALLWYAESVNQGMAHAGCACAWAELSSGADELRRRRHGQLSASSAHLCAPAGDCSPAAGGRAAAGQSVCCAAGGCLARGEALLANPTITYAQTSPSLETYRLRNQVWRLSALHTPSSVSLYFISRQSGCEAIAAQEADSEAALDPL